MDRGYGEAEMKMGLENSRISNPEFRIEIRELKIIPAFRISQC